MLSVRFFYAFVLTCLYYTYGERRIIGGDVVKTPENKYYMAYLLQARSSMRTYDAWLCGAAIINRWLLLTSAACVEDVQNMYAIAGLDEYVKPKDLEDNPCTRKWRRKVVFTCVPVEYNLQYDNVSKWSHNDIAVVKVEQPFSVNNEMTKDCPYKPNGILINFDPEYEKPGTDGIVLGWGHSYVWRFPNSSFDYNHHKLRYVSVSVLDNEECKKYFTKPDMGKQIDDYMICTFHEGKLDDMGRPRDKQQVYDISGREKGFCQVIYEAVNCYFGLDLHNTFSNFFISFSTLPNDHGGPLVTWINGEVHVIGIASVFRVDHRSRCIGPFLYTSTAKNREFIECISNDLIHSDDRPLGRRRTICDRPKNGKKFNILRRYIKWTEDANIHRLECGVWQGGMTSPKLFKLYVDELILELSSKPVGFWIDIRLLVNIPLRPQIPMSYYGGK